MNHKAYVYETEFRFSIIRLYIVLILDRAIQHKRGLFRRDAGDVLFCYISRDTFYSVDKQDFESLWHIEMLAVRIALSHWLYFYYIC